jgi:hypothetical protein
MERLLRVEFGPSRAKRFAKAVAQARQGPGECTELEPGRYRLRVALDGDPDAYRGLARLLEWVRHWRATEVYEDDELVSSFQAKEMAWCASFYLSSFDGCRHRFEYGLLPRCALCPLFDAERAIRAGMRDQPARRLTSDPDPEAPGSDAGGLRLVSGPDLMELLQKQRPDWIPPDFLAELMRWELPDWVDADFLFPDYPPEDWGEAAGEQSPG